jgi:tetratricopeptide (TPR) repeat protein
LLDPSFAPAWAALADAYLLSNSYVGRSDDSAYDGAEEAIGKALGLDSELAAAHVSRGLLRLQRDRDWSGSEASYRRAIELERSYVTARQWYSELLSLSGRHEEALQQIGIALELDPLSPLVHAAAGQRLNAAGRYLEALSRFQDAEALGADFNWLFRERAWALEHTGRHQESLELLVSLAKTRRGVDDRQVAELERAVQENGLIGYYNWEIQNHFTRVRRRPGFPTWLAAAYSGAGQTEDALEWLSKATEEQNLWLLHTLKSPAFDAIRDDRRFVEILRDLLPDRSETARANQR